MDPLIHEKDESLCRQWCVEDCFTARHYAPQDIPTVVGECPEQCNNCLYMERYKRNDANWTPEPIDKQYHHWFTR